MNMLLATAAAADQIDKTLFVVALGCYGVSGLLALVAAGYLLFAPTKSVIGARVALAGLVLGFVQVSVTGYVHLTGFVPLEVDGTPVTPPLWLVLLVPSLPFLANLILFFAHRRRGGRSSE